MNEKIKNIVAFLLNYKISNNSNISEQSREEVRVNSVIKVDNFGLTRSMRESVIDYYLNQFNEWVQKEREYYTDIAPHEVDSKNIPSIESIENEINKKYKKQVSDLEGEFRSKKEISSLDAELKHFEGIYLDLQNKFKREANTFPAILYIILLIGIGSVEWLINSSTFFANWGVPAVAAGFTAIVAFTVAFASHEYGKTLKQRKFLFGEHIPPDDKYWHLSWLMVSTIALLLVFTWVGYERYTWATEEIARFSSGPNLLGLEASLSQEEISIKNKVMVSVAANVLVWILGFAIAFWAHDEDPEYVSVVRKYKKLKNLMAKKFEPLNKRILAKKGEEKKILDEARNKNKSLIDLSKELEKNKTQLILKKEALMSYIKTQIENDIRHFIDERIKYSSEKTVEISYVDENTGEKKDKPNIRSDKIYDKYFKA